MDELRRIAGSLSSYPHFFVTYRTARTTQSDGTYVLPNLLESRVDLLLSFFRILRIFLRERPSVVISTGAEIAIPAFVLGKLLACRLIFIESMCRVATPSGTGRILFPLSDLFIVHWPELADAYGPRAHWVDVLS